VRNRAYVAALASAVRRRTMRLSQLGESKRGQQYQSILPSVPTSAAVWQVANQAVLSDGQVARPRCAPSPRGHEPPSSTSTDMSAIGHRHHLLFGRMLVSALDLSASAQSGAQPENAADTAPLTLAEASGLATLAPAGPALGCADGHLGRGRSAARREQGILLGGISRRTSEVGRDSRSRPRSKCPYQTR
jgi:hypothetical protein